MSSRGNENIEVLGQLFHNYFEEKYSPQDSTTALGRRIIDKAQKYNCIMINSRSLHTIEVGACTLIHYLVTDSKVVTVFKRITHAK